MASPIAGNESFRNVENVTASGAETALDSVDVSQLNVNVLTTENNLDITTTLLSNVKPSLEGLPVTTHTGSAAPNYVEGINVSDYNGSVAVGARTVQLPAATVGKVVVHLQAGAVVAGGAALEFDVLKTAGDYFAPGTNLLSLSAGPALPLVFSSSAATTPYSTDLDWAGVANSTLGAGALIYFWCTKQGEWHVAHDLASAATVATGIFTFSSN
jgi:hypothetical protein